MPIPSLETPRKAATYHDFPTLWKDADPDIRSWKQANRSTRSFGLHILRVVLGMIFGMGSWFGGIGSWGAFSLGNFLVNLIGLLSLILCVVLMVKAFQGVRFKLPVAGGVAESLAGQGGFSS